MVPATPETQFCCEDRDDKSSLKQLQRLFGYDDYFRYLMENSPARQIAEQILQGEVVPVNMQYFSKSAGIGQATPPHQDGYCFHLAPCEAVTGWFALENTDEEHGCIHCFRGSPKENDFLEYGQSGVLGFSQGMTDFGTPEDLARSMSFPSPAGTFLMHHAKTIHWAGANNSATRLHPAQGFIDYV